MTHTTPERWYQGRTHPRVAVIEEDREMHSVVREIQRPDYDRCASDAGDHYNRSTALPPRR